MAGTLTRIQSAQNRKINPIIGKDNQVFHHNRAIKTPTHTPNTIPPFQLTGALRKRSINSIAPSFYLIL
ncbi:MAG: hypothetical protein Q8P35_00060 [Candidatus Yanofskybacteria bacterium]|nr:hypothetical protein [Candidatus Yanofskybacteria bacterium]